MGKVLVMGNRVRIEAAIESGKEITIKTSKDELYTIKANADENYKYLIHDAQSEDGDFATLNFLTTPMTDDQYKKYTEDGEVDTPDEIMTENIVAGSIIGFGTVKFLGYASTGFVSECYYMDGDTKISLLSE